MTKNDLFVNSYSCEFCNKIYSHRQSKYKHQLKCKNKKNKEDQNEMINLLIEQNQEMKKTLMEIINKNCKVHPGSKNHEALDFV